MDTQRLREVFDKDGAFAIVVGQNYSIDEMGAALSILLSLEAVNKNVSIISAKQPLVEVSSLIGIDRVKESFESKSGDLIVSFPYQNDEIGKVSYTLENGLLNIIVKPKNDPLSFGEKDVIFKRSSETPDVLITVGVKRISELQSLFDVQSLKDTVIVNIDKAGNNEGFGDIALVSQSASSVSEQVASLLMSLDYQLDSDISQNLMSGIIAATSNFQSPRTSSLAFEMAGILLRNGARREPVRQQREQIRTPQQFGYPPAPRPAMQQQRPVQQSRPIQQPVKPYSRDQKKDEVPSGKQDAPPDWLAPKIFKGSTTVE